jgi:hypothetical protein
MNRGALLETSFGAAVKAAWSSERQKRDPGSRMGGLVNDHSIAVEPNEVVVAGRLSSRSRRLLLLGGDC